jgi:hypothetical protein
VEPADYGCCAAQHGPQSGQRRIPASYDCCAAQRASPVSWCPRAAVRFLAEILDLAVQQTRSKAAEEEWEKVPQLSNPQLRRLPRYLSMNVRYTVFGAEVTKILPELGKYQMSSTLFWVISYDVSDCHILKKDSWPEVLHTCAFEPSLEAAGAPGDNSRGQSHPQGLGSASLVSTRCVQAWPRGLMKRTSLTTRTQKVNGPASATTRAGHEQGCHAAC